MISIQAPIKDIVDKLRLQGYFHPQKSRYCANTLMGYLEDFEIVKCYSQVIYSMLSYYGPVDNISSIRGLASQLKLGCLYTIARKHKKGKHWVYLKYGRDCGIRDAQHNVLTKLPSDQYIASSSSKRAPIQDKT